MGNAVQRGRDQLSWGFAFALGAASTRLTLPRLPGENEADCCAFARIRESGQRVSGNA
jgi:hypothetical protein